MKEKIQEVVAAVVLVGGMVWTPLGDYVNAAGGQAEIVALILAGYKVAHGIIAYGHGKAAGALLLAFAVMSPGAALAQDNGAALLSYDTSAAGIMGVSGEVDLNINDTPVSVVGHFGHAPTGGQHGAIGPRVSGDVGPVRLLGHYLYGAVGLGATAMTNAVHRAGGAIDIPFGSRGFFRVGGNADAHGGDVGTVFSGNVGVGVKF